MGFFSWTTSDTEESISNKWSERGAKTVYLLQPNGEPAIKEENYDGYGVFGGVDVFDWLVDHNQKQAGEYEDKRSRGIDMDLNESIVLEHPLKFSFDPDAKYEDLTPAKNCPDQGFFYDDNIFSDEEW